MAKSSGLSWTSMNIEAPAHRTALLVAPLEAWCLCPSCGSGGYHHLGERRHVRTGRTVRLDPLTGQAPPTVAATRAQLARVTDRAVDAVETREQITRECLYCAHRWPQATGNTGAHVPTFEDTLREQLLNVAAVYSVPPAHLRAV